jgi:hypothetical protein
MAGKKGRSGRRSGSTSWWRNPIALARQHLNVLIEMWLAGVPIQVGPDRWLKPPTERRYTVPPKIKWLLAVMAIRQVMMTDCEVDRVLSLDVADVLECARRRAPSITLRRAVRLKPRDEREAAYREYLDDLATAWKK